jgi:hypothetical protein
MGGSKKMQQVRSIANRPSGGGNKKQGLPPSIGRAGWFNNMVRTRAGGYFRDIPASDPCPTKEVVGNQDVSTQDKANLLRGVTKITGNLTISGTVTDLSPFDCLKEVTGSIDFGDDELKLETISGFNNMVKVGGAIVCFGNEVVKTISGFRNLINIGKAEVGKFGVIGLLLAESTLVTISGFGSLRSCEGVFAISNNTLVTISGFGSLRSCGGEFAISENNALLEAQFSAAFNNLQLIESDITVSGNNGSNWGLPTGWTKLNWGVDTTNRKLNDTIGPGTPGNFSVAVATELFTLPDKDGTSPP